MTMRNRRLKKYLTKEDLRRMHQVATTVQTTLGELLKELEYELKKHEK